MKRTSLAKLLAVVGLAVMLIGSIDPLEGSVIIVPGLGLAALAGFVGQCTRRRLLYWSFAFVAAGVAAMFVLSAFGGAGGQTGRSIWWALVILPYPVGWILGLVGTIITIREMFKRRAGPDEAMS
jgi:hypothetical protein